MKKLYPFIKCGFNLCLFVCLIFVSVVNIAAQNQINNLSPAAQCGQFGLRGFENIRISSNATSVITADFNNDAIPDTAVAMPNTNSIAVALGNSQTGFSEAREFVAGVSPQEAVAGDFNRDGEIDLAVTSAFDRFVNILIGDGQGNFTLTDAYSVGGSPRKIETADFNNDGWLDLIVGNTESPNVGLNIYLGGANGFTAANQPLITINGIPRSFKTADFNHDGNIDFITVAQNPFGDSYIVLFNGNGQGGFTSALTLTVMELYALDVADFNGDGFADFATPGYRDSKIRVYLNNQNGGFNPPLETVIAWGSFSSIIAADMNGDAKIDLLNGGFILLNDGNVNFTLREISNAQAGAIADFNGDGILDLASAGGISDSFGNPPYFSFSISYGTGDLNFEAPVFLPPLSSPTSVVSEDFNGDGRKDVAAASGAANSVKISFQNADGTFTLPTTSVFSNGGSANNYSVLVAADFNGDGSMDLATNLNWARSVYILLNNGNGQFTTSSVLLNAPPFSVTPQFLQVGDFNNDNRPDIAALGSAYTILLNNGMGGFDQQTPVSVNSTNFNTFAVGDFNGDSNLDMAVTRGNLGMNIYNGNGNGTFTLSGTITLSSYSTMVRAADYNGDSITDLIAISGGSFTGGSPTMTTLISNRTGSFIRTDYILTGAPNDIVTGDFNNDSFKDFLLINSPSSSVTLYAGNGGGGFTAQAPLPTMSGAYWGAASDLNQDQKTDLVLAGRFNSTQIFYNNLATAPCLSVNNVQAAENSGAAQFTVSLSAVSAQTVSVNYRVVGRNAMSGSDFGNVSGTLTFVPGEISKTVNVPILDDNKDEADETFQLVLENPVNASLADQIGVAAILDNDATPSISVGDVSITEGTGGNPTRMMFTFSLSAATGRKAKADFALFDETAQGGIDFDSTAGTVVFNDGESVKQIAVNINPDAYVEANETLRLRLTNPVNLTISDNEAVGTIVNDDIGGTVQFNNAIYQVSETSDSIIVSVSRTGGNAAGIVVGYSTSNGTATANRDYLPSSGKLIFNADETVKTFVIPILDDAVDETDIETINVSLDYISGGAILGSQSTAVINLADDDPPPSLTLSDLSINEGNSGQTTANFNVRLPAVSEQIISVNFTTANGTAIAPVDYQSQNGTLTFAPGETLKNISITINGDTEIEPNETFFVNLSAPVNVVLQNAQAVGNILNDDFNARRAPYDFDGDGKTDISIFRPSVGQWWYLKSSNSGNAAFSFGNNTDVLAPGDFTGDGKTDICFFRPSEGTWYVLRSEDSSFFAFAFGTNGDIPAPADYDGDGKTDPAVFRPSEARWYINRSTQGFLIINFGFAEDKPIPSDFDGDGKADIAIWRPSVGQWWYLRSSDGTNRAFSFGVTSDKPVPGDYTGDGKSDIAFWRPSDGFWYILRSEDNSFFSFPFGTNGDIPAPADYDGDGKFDPTVFRPSQTTWYASRSSAGLLVVNFGFAEDRPVPNAFVP